MGLPIEKLLEVREETISLYTDSGAALINGHTPQHVTSRELEDLGFVTDELRIFTIIRSPIDRVISEYFYLLKKRPDLNTLFSSFDEFLDNKNNNLFDNHNLSSGEFLVNHAGLIEQRIEIVNFFDIAKLESFIGLEGLKEFHFNCGEKSSLELSPAQLNKILAFFSKDFDYFHFAKFPINSRGYWEGRDGSGHVHDESLCAELVSYFKEDKIKSVFDFGCGLGKYSRAFSENDISSEAYDGNPNTPQLTNGLGKILELSTPFDLGHKWNCVVALE
ncbi:MAG: hypothetical protein IT292_03445 [Deltaproteobacteria bacterium]|nr:hypothetical protein [Deltaproteobacteria bacterium]